MLKSLMLAGVLSLAAVAGAYADEGDPVANAVLAKPVARATQVIAGGVVWSCKDQACSGPATADRTFSVSSCKALVKEVGPVTAYGVDSRQLKSDELQRCVGAK